jgi:DNA-binding XRE family transcriptional regulator
MKKSPELLPKNLKIMHALGEQIRLARLRRKLSTEQVAERAGIGRNTLYNIEMGSPTARCWSYNQETCT